ncbi:exo-alpha-sialidase [candidate division KSB1 bacterium]|nr:exo-alpha-sialidase [candidate division KSB1 bacterium]
MNNFDDELALRSPEIILSPGEAYSDNTRKFQGIPGIERAPNGRLWAVWYGGGEGEGEQNYVMLSTSIDDGESWSGLRLVIDPPGPVRAFDPCLWYDPEGKLWLFWAQSNGWFDGRAGVWAITTANATEQYPDWSEPRRLCNGVMMNKPMILSDGEWLLPVAVWQRSNRIDIPIAEKRSNVFVSPDKGHSLQFRGGAEIPECTYSEHIVVEKSDGSLWMLVRTEYGIGESHSNDLGKTWSRGKPSGIPHPSARFFIRRLNSGKLLLVKHGSMTEKTGRSQLTAYFSDDDGKSWSSGLLLDEREGVSYPDGVQSPDGVIYIIYDFERRSAKQILMTTFTEADLLHGKFISDKARKQLIVNQAWG